MMGGGKMGQGMCPMCMMQTMATRPEGTSQPMGMMDMPGMPGMPGRGSGGGDTLRPPAPADNVTGSSGTMVPGPGIKAFPLKNIKAYRSRPVVEPGPGG